MRETESFEIWTWRNMKNISWKDQKNMCWTYEKINCRAMGKECWRNWIPRTCFRAEHQ